MTVNIGPFSLSEEELERWFQFCAQENCTGSRAFRRLLSGHLAPSVEEAARALEDQRKNSAGNSPHSPGRNGSTITSTGAPSAPAVGASPQKPKSSAGEDLTTQQKISLARTLLKGGK